jgi:amino acid adenylation domain-containing protein
VGTVMELIGEQVRRTPERIAVRYEGASMSYGALWEESERVGCWLREVAGLGRGDLVGVLLDRELMLVPVIYGILRAGCVYVPMDPHYPAGRVGTIVGDGLKVVVTRGRYLSGWGSVQGSVSIMDLDDWGSVRGRAMAGMPAGIVQGEDLAYVIYTSGSTGKPKGVMIEHRSVVNRLWWMQRAYPLGEGDVILQKTPVVFDVSVWELFWWSFTGASVCLLRPGGEKDPQAIREAISRWGVTTLHFVPSMLKTFLAGLGDTAGLGSLRQVFASGEALGSGVVNSFARTLHGVRGLRLINLYGPTEATVDVSYEECELSGEIKEVPIGRPISNTQLYILDGKGHPVPIGVSGELYIGGDGVGRGYLNRGDLTAERFKGDVYGKVPGGRLYRTGDRAGWLADGRIMYQGRMDDQVKIRGMRVEPGEIAGCLEKYAGIRESVVVERGEEGDKYLVAYYVSEGVMEEGILRKYLLEQLPEYMVPYHYVAVKSMPLTINGKLDRKALPEPVREAGTDHAGPATETEELLAGIWAEVLHLDKAVIGVNKSFFELGGNSLKIVALNALVNQRLELHLSVLQMLRYPTISSLLKFINEGETDAENYIEEANREVAGMQNLLNTLYTK